MPEIALGEILFILVMFFLVGIISTVSFYLFFKQYKKEKLANEQEKLARKQKASQTE